MADLSGSTLAASLLASFVLLISATFDPCPDFCTCEQFRQLNCSSAGLSLAPQGIPPSMSELDLSNNQLDGLTFKSKYHSLHKVWLGHNGITHLTLCVDRDLTGQGGSGLRGGLGPRRRCLLWAPTLQLLSAERNQLQALPRGLGRQRQLEILDLSFNKISKLDPDIFNHLTQLEELHLQNNLISVIPPQTFDKLDKLKVLDLSSNLLTALHPSTYASLRAVGADVALRGNRWICDCDMRPLQRGMAVDRTRGLKTWSIECAAPPSLSGMNLMQLDKDDLLCPGSGPNLKPREELTVHRGAETLLTCSEPDAVWWTPYGETTGSQDGGGLLIRVTTDQDEGLYACMSQSRHILSIFKVQIHDKIRRSRSVPQEMQHSLEKMGQPRNATVKQSDFALAVSLSVIITFIVAFILGVILQPYICICWQKITTKKQKPQTNAAVPNHQEEQYVNEAYLHCEDVDDFEPHRERRVTFTEYTEEGNMQYYDTVAGDLQEANGPVVGPGHASSESSDESGSEGGKGKKIEFEPIPDRTDRNSLSSHSSHSSRGEKILKNSCSTPNTSQTVVEQVQMTEVATIEVSQISPESQNETLGFSSEPFAEWSPHQRGSLMDPDFDNGDPFEFSDSAPSGSPLVPNVNEKLSVKSLSSNSDISDSEPTHYTVNADSEEEEAEVFDQNVATNKQSQIVKSSSSSSSESETEGHFVVSTWPVVDLASNEKTVENELQKENVLPNIEQKPPTAKKRRAPPPPRKTSSSSSDGEGNTQLVRKGPTKTVHFEERSSRPAVNLENVLKVKRRLDFKVQFADYESFPSSDSEDERVYEEIEEHEGPIQPVYLKQESANLSIFKTTSSTVDGSSSSSDSEDEHLYENVTQVQQNVSIGAVNLPGSRTSSSSESEDEHKIKVQVNHENLQQTTAPIKTPVVEDSPWPAVDLVRIPKVKCRLDIKERVRIKGLPVPIRVPPMSIKAPKPESGTSSSSESEDEHKIKVQVNHENLQQTTAPIKTPVVEDSPWPAVSLVRIPKVKRRLDIKERVRIKGPPVAIRVPPMSIKAPKPESGTSSSSESEDEQENEVNVNQEILKQTTTPIKTPAAINVEESQWPVVDLVRIPKVKRRLDIKERVKIKGPLVPIRVPPISIKVPKPESETSSSSESEDEQEIKTSDEEQAIAQIKPATTVNPDQDSQWPVIDLVKVPKVKRRLEIRPAVQASESLSSDSEDDLHVTQVQVKLPSAPVSVLKSDSGSSSSESEDEMETQIKYKENHQEIPTKQPSVEPPWPVIDLARIPKVYRRLDIKERVDMKTTPEVERLPLKIVKVPEPDSGTSSSSESEDEHEIKEKRRHEENVHIGTTETWRPNEPQWPVINLTKAEKVKRRLDIKLTASLTPVQLQGRLPSTTIHEQKPGSETSSSSESDDDQQTKIIQTESLQQVAPPAKHPNDESPWPVIDPVKIPKVRRRLDIKEVNSKQTPGPNRVPSAIVKIPKPESGTSSSSESEDDLPQTMHPLKPPTALKPKPWPVVDLVKVQKVRRRLDIKTTVPASESSASSSEDERIQVNVTQVQGKLPTTSVSLQRPYSGTSSSSDSEDDQNIKVVEKETLQQIAPPAESEWPVINVVRLPKIKRRLDVKGIVNVKVPERDISTDISVPKADSGTSSSSESEDEQEIKFKPNQVDFGQTIKPPIPLKPQQEAHWPVVNLVKIPKIKQRLDFRAKTSSSSNSEDERLNVTTLQGRVPSTSGSLQKSESGTSSSSESEEETPPDREAQWPTLNLKHAGKLKRRLDIKIKSPAPTLPLVGVSDSEKPSIAATQTMGRLPSTPESESGTSSSSESEAEQETREVRKDDVLLVTSENKPPVSQWPVIDPIAIPKLKRRLDIKEKVPVKATKPLKVSKSDSETSSSSEREDEREIKTTQKENLKQTTETIQQPVVDSPWPAINLVRLPIVKRRLDIKEVRRVQEIVPSKNIKVSKPDSGTSSSSDSEEEIPTRNVTSTKPRLSASSSSESDGKTVQKVGVTSIGSPAELQTQWPAVNLRGITQIKRRLDFKIPSQSPPSPIRSSKGSHRTITKPQSSSSSDEEERAVGKIGIGLNTKGPSMKQDVSESSSSSDDENAKPQPVISQDKDFIKVSPNLNTLHSLTKNSQNIELERYNVVTDDLRAKSSSGSPSPAVTPELQSKWATMNLGVSRFRKRLDISKTSSPSSPPPSSPKQNKMIPVPDFPYAKGTTVTDHAAVVPAREQNVDSSSSSSESEDDVKLSGQPSGDFVSSQVRLSSIPKVKRSLVVTKQQNKYSSSGGEKTVSTMALDLSGGIPRVKRRLNIKAPTPPPSSASSEDEKVYAYTFSEVTNQRSIEYKRTIMKSPSYDSYDSSVRWQSHREPLYVESNTKTPKKLSLDNIKRKLLPSKQTELPPNLRWTSVGTHLAEHPAPVLRRHQDGYMSSQPLSTPPPVPRHSSSDSSSSDDEREVKTTQIVTQTTYSPKIPTFQSSPTILNAVNFEERTERKGLSALKAMSSSRRTWESDINAFADSAPVGVDYHPGNQTVHQKTIDAKTKMSQAQSYSVSALSPVAEERRLAGMTYGIPSYRRHVIKSTELPEYPPPPVPSTPLPEESPDFTWRSPQSSLSRGNIGSYNVQQKKTLEESVDDPFFDNPNISAV